MVWDRGHWIPDGDPEAAYEKGRLKFTLAGEKLQGRWILVRMGGARNRDEHNWLLIKEREEAAQTVVSADSTLAVATSVKSGMTMNQIAAARPAEWRSDRAPSRSTTPVPTQSAKTKLPSADQRGSRTKVDRGSDMTPCPEWIAPQLATLVDGVPEGDEWLYELKYDGYRMLSRINQGAGRLLSRNRREWTAKLPEHAKAVSQLRVRNAWLDGKSSQSLPMGR